MVPVFFDGANSLFFQIAGMVHPKLRTALLPREFLNKGKRVISVRIGNVIPSRKSEAFEDDEKLIGYLRMRTYVLKHRCPGAANRGKHGRRDLTLIGPQGVPRSIEAETLPGSGKPSIPATAHGADGFAVLFAKANQIPTYCSRSGAFVRSLSVRRGKARAESRPRAASTSITHIFLSGTGKRMKWSGPTGWDR